MIKFESIPYYCPRHRQRLDLADAKFVCVNGCEYLAVAGIPRFVEADNYSDAFGEQWKRYRTTQLDSYTGSPISETRLRRCLGETIWSDLRGKQVLEAGCGAGRFTEILLREGAIVTSIDLSDAVSANQDNFPQDEDHRIAQADILELPFDSQQFDVVICLGVIQHTPDSERSIEALYGHVKPGGWLVIDHYTYTLGYFTRTAPVFRFFMRQMKRGTTINFTERMVNLLLPIHKAVRNYRPAQTLLSRVSPLVVYYQGLPQLNDTMQKEWALLDTHDSLTDYYKRFRTKGHIHSTMEQLGQTDIWCEYGGNGVEARGRRRSRIEMPKENLAVCMLVTNIDAPTGGVQRNSRLLLQEFNGRGLRTFVCTRNYYGRPKNETVNGTSYHRSPVLGKLMAVNGVIYLFDTFAWLIKNKKKYDVIHCQQVFGPTMVAAVASYFIGKPILTRITLSGKTGEAAAIREMPVAWIRLRLIRRVSKWIALTREMAGELKNLGIADEKIRIIYNATEMPDCAAYDSGTKHAMRTKIGIGGEKIGVFAGRLSKEKGLNTLIDAWGVVVQKHNNARLLLLGEGGEFRNVESELREQADRLGLADKIDFLGHVDNAKEYILASDAFVLPTTTEGMSNALVEAFASGAAIVATDIPANREICEADVNSLLVPVGKVRELADAIDRLFSSADLSEKLGRAARHRAERDLSIDKMVLSYIQAYQEMLGSDVL
jgi:glycosyltransferase involved in cell wall biosynthesis/2-polyprenyl-3-methyl-5-hydroxy-6-metoxy-1,4-benzoquinol methylase